MQSGKSLSPLPVGYSGQPMRDQHRMWRVMLPFWLPDHKCPCDLKNINLSLLRIDMGFPATPPAFEKVDKFLDQIELISAGYAIHLVVFACHLQL